MTNRPRWLVLIRSKPYACEKAVSGIDAALACGAFGQPVIVIFEGDGVDVLRANQSPPPGERNLFKQVMSFPLYDIESVYVVDQESKFDEEITVNASAELCIKSIDLQELGEHIAQATHVLSF